MDKLKRSSRGRATNEELAGARSPRQTTHGRGAPTIKDIARRLGVSYATVSRALNGHHHASAHIKARVAAVAAELGYVPHVGARMMRAQRSRIVGLVIPDLSSQIFIGVVATLAEHCRKAGYQLVLSLSNNDPEHECELVEALTHVHASGIVIAPCSNGLERTHNLLRQLPCVQLGDRNRSLAVPTVSLNDREAVRAATHHLVQLGHKRIGFIGGEEDIATFSERLTGFREALADGCIEDSEELALRGPVTVKWGWIAVARLLSLKPPPTAVVVSSFAQTKGAIEMLHDAKISVPGDFSIIGFGDLDWFHLWGPGLTTMDVPLDDLAEAVSLQFFEQLPRGGKFQAPQPFLMRLPGKLLVRNSTAPPKAGRES